MEVKYNSLFDGNPKIIDLHTLADVGAELEHSLEWKDYTIVEITKNGPDFNLMDGIVCFSPLWYATL